jgi:hypothetical protein
MSQATGVSVLARKARSAHSRSRRQSSSDLQGVSPHFLGAPAFGRTPFRKWKLAVHLHDDAQIPFIDEAVPAMIDHVEFIPVGRGGSTSPRAKRSGRNACNGSATFRANENPAVKGYRSLHVGASGVVVPARIYSKNFLRRGIFFMPVKISQKINERPLCN